jgi:tetratricopeptide (TPR) repeat protein
MKTRVVVVAVVVVVALSAGVALATWYDDYEAGMKAIQAGNWQVAVQKMTAAIAQKPKENNKERAYGTLFYNYHPYYYRAVAYLNLGQYKKAIEDLDVATGPGEADMGSIENLHQRAQLKLDQSAAAVAEQPPAQAPPAQPQPQVSRSAQPVAPPPVTASTPAAPSVDPALRQRAENALSAARQKIDAAKGRRATGSPQFAEAVQTLSSANVRRATARTNDDFAQVEALALNAGLQADAATAPAAAGAPAAPAVVQGRPAAATDAVLGDLQKRVRRALEDYFNGEFERAASQFDQLTRDGDLSHNGLIWAFLGASQYSIYAFEADAQYREAARKSFEKARELRPSLRKGLPDRYFSRRIRNFFNSLG